jgi:hypothetical protein
MSETTETELKQAVESIREAVLRACDDIYSKSVEWSDAIRTGAEDKIRDIEARDAARSPAAREVSVDCSFHFTTEVPVHEPIHLKHLQIRFADRSLLGVGADNDAFTGTRLAPGRRYRVDLSFIDITDEPEDEPTRRKNCSHPLHPPDCLACEEMSVCTCCKSSKPKEDMLNGICSRCEANELAPKPKFRQGRCQHCRESRGDILPGGRCAACVVKLDAQLATEVTPLHCKNCRTEIYIGNCCGEACTKAWMAEIEAAHRSKSKGRRFCKRCAQPHEMKSNFCGKCDDSE